jgi:transposase
MFNANEVTDGITSGIEARQQRGLAIAAKCKINRVRGEEWAVPSTVTGFKYVVKVGKDFSCNCPDHELRKCKCKHVYAVEYVIEREQNSDGSTTVTETITASKRTTYGQDWSNYNKAQTNEKDQFQELMYDLCAGLSDWPPGNGAPRLPLRDAVFSAVFKVYSTVSGRRFMSDLRDAQSKGYISKVPHFNSIFNYLENPELTTVLTDLILETSKPLSAIESDFAVDSTGFMSTRFVRWYDQKYGEQKESRTWVKAHICCGVKTNVVTAVEIYDRNANDSPVLPTLVSTTAENFALSEISADKAYLSAENLAVVEKHGATPFIPFKSNSKAGSNGKLWDKMFKFFTFNRDEYLSHYHKRSNIESTMNMVKAKFGDAVRSKSDTAMKNEVLAKILCHNICCLISAMYELSIDPTFWRGLHNKAVTCTTRGT